MNAPLPALLILVAACTSADPPASLWVGGCDLRTPAGECWTATGTVRVWSTAPVAVDGRALDGEPIDGGWRYAIEVADPRSVATRGRPPIRLIAEVPGVGDCPASTSMGRGWCLRLAARQALVDGGPLAAAPLYDEAGELFLDAGWDAEAGLQRHRAAWVRGQALGASGPAPSHDDLDDEDAWDATAWLMRARLAELGHRHAGRLHDARRVQRRIRQLEERVFSADEALDATLVEARLDLALGDTERALDTLAGVLDSATVDCRGADVAAHVGWQVSLLAWSGRAERLDLVQRARAILAAAPDCDGQGRPADRAVDRAMFAWVEGDTATARSTLEGVGDLPARAETTLWRHLLAAEIAAESGDHGGALAHALEATRTGEASGLVEARWLARDQHAHALAVAGRHAEASTRFDDAAIELLAVARATPLLGGRSAFLDQRAVAAGRHVDALLALGRTQDAFAVGRAWRRAAFAGAWATLDVADTAGDTGWTEDLERLERQRARRSALEQRARLAPESELPALREALRAAREEEAQLLDTAILPLGGAVASTGRPREPGEGELLVVPAGHRRGKTWRALWRDDRGVLASGVLDDAAVRDEPGRLLDVAGERLALASALTLFLPADLESLDLHLVPVEGTPLAARIPVRWSLDLPTPAASETGAAAVVVGDPEGGLRGARAEAEHAAAVLRAEDVPARVLGSGTTRDQLADALARGPRWVHVAAHGELSDGRPRVRLAEGSTWTTVDALALASAPRELLLQVCHGAAPGERALAAEGLAHAHVRGGSEAVLAPWRPIDDKAAATFAASIYAERPWVVGLEAATLATFRRAHARGHLSDLGVYRLITP